MRCRPGDHAFIIRSIFPENIGRVVLVVQHSKMLLEHWECESVTHLKGLEILTSKEVFLLNFNAHDQQLLPIRDPGDEAVDEMLRPLPKKETSDV